MPLKREPSPRYKLKTLPKQLRRLSFPTSPVDIALARFAAAAFDKYLEGTCSLESAFGLGGKRGAPGWPKARLKLAKAVYALRMAGHSWKSVMEHTVNQGFGETDLGNIQRTYREFKVHLMSRDIALALKRDLDPPTTARKSKLCK